MRRFALATIPWLLGCLFIHGAPLPCASAAHGGAGTGNIQFQRLPHGDFFQGQIIRDIEQDRDGFLWIATHDGLFRYDGREAVQFRNHPRDPETLSSDYAVDLCADGNGALWVATQKGLNRLDPRTGVFRRFLPERGNPDSVSSEWLNAVSCLGGFVYAAGEDGALNEYDPASDRFTRYFPDPGNGPPPPVTDIRPAGPNRLILCTRIEGRVFFFDTRTKKFQVVESNGKPYSAREILCALEDRKGRVWFGTWGNGLHLAEPGGEARHFMHDPDDPASLSGNIVQDIFEDENGTIWIAVRDKGLCIYIEETNAFRRVRAARGDSAGLTGDSVMTVNGTRNGLIWFGTMYEGISYIDPSANHFGHWTAGADGNPLGPVYAMLAARDGSIWAGTRDRGLQRFDPAADRFSMEIPGGQPVTALHEDRSGRVWIGYWNSNAPVRAYDPETGESRVYEWNRETAGGFAGGTVRAFMEDRNGAVWVGVEEYGVNVIDPGTGSVRRIVHDPDREDWLSGPSVTCFAEAPGGAVWIGTQFAGLNKYDSGSNRFEVFRYDPDDPESLAGDEINCLLVDSRGRLWVGTRLGLCVLEASGRGFIRYTEDDGPGNRPAEGLLEDGKGRIWVSSGDGTVSVLEPETGETRRFGRLDGLRQISFLRDSVCSAPNGDLYFGGMNGINRVRPADLRKNAAVPPVAVTAMRVMGEPYPIPSCGEGQPVRFTHKDNFIQFAYAALDFARPGKNRYAHKLEPVEKDWVYNGTNNTAQYATLAPGSYRFRVIGSNNDGVWNMAGATLAFVIAPPFWKTWWFGIAAAAVLTASAAALYLRRVQVMKKHQRRLEKEIERQTREIRQYARSLETANQEKNRLLGVTAHDLRNPIGLVLAFGKHILKDANSNLGENSRSLLERIQSISRFMLNLVDDLLDLAKIESGVLELETEPADLDGMIRANLDLNRILARQKTIRILYECLDSLPIVRIDPVRFEQLLNNLVSNAVKFSPPGSDVRVTASLADGGIRLSIRDRGRGITKDDLQRIFTPFAVGRPGGKKTERGTGLGLAIVKKIADAHGWTISVESAEGRGSEFALVIPVPERAVPRPAEDKGIAGEYKPARGAVSGVSPSINAD